MEIDVDEQVQDTDLRFHAGELVARLVDGEGSPVSNASIRLFSSATNDASSSTETSFPELLTQQSSDEDGIFRFLGLAAGEYLLGIKAPSMKAIEVGPVSIAEDEEKRLPDIAVEDGNSLRVLVYDHRGQPLEGATIFAAYNGKLRLGGSHRRHLGLQLRPPDP